MELTEKQLEVIKRVVFDVRKNVREIKVGGYAGTGKTTILKYLTKFFPDYAVAAYTGKAANVLRRKSIPGTTIHSRIYKPVFDNGVVEWTLTSDPECDGFFIDEASMVGQDIYDDLKSFDLPIIFVGDHGQLEPVDSKFNLMQTPDYTLEEIHRNAGDIAKFAESLRHGFNARGFRGETDMVEFVNRPDDELLTSVDQVICAFNKTRVEINNKIRAAKGYSELVEVGERVMCLRNNRKQGLFNGMQGKVLALYQGKNGRKYMDFEFDNLVMEGIWYDQSTFGKEKYDIKHGDTANPFDYAHCITCHKSQGDEFNKVLVIEQKCRNWSHKRWAYTAASRAKEKLYWNTAN